MGKRGPKEKFKITAEVISQVKAMASVGVSQEIMYNYYGVGHDTWFKRVKKHPELAQVIKQGHANSVVLAAGKLYEGVRKGNMTAIIFYLKTQGGFSERSVVELNNGKGAPPIELKLNTIDPVEAAKIYQKIMMGN